MNQKQRLHFGQRKSQELQTKVNQGWSSFTLTSFFAFHEIFGID
jgi:hypothetical protein